MQKNTSQSYATDAEFCCWFLSSILCYETSTLYWLKVNESIDDKLLTLACEVPTFILAT